jgi:hypothetical protein
VVVLRARLRPRPPPPRPSKDSFSLLVTRGHPELTRCMWRETTPNLKYKTRMLKDQAR